MSVQLTTTRKLSQSVDTVSATPTLKRLISSQRISILPDRHVQ